MSKNYVGSNGFDDEPIVTKEKIYAFVALLVILAIAFILFPSTNKNALTKNTDNSNNTVSLESYNPIINSTEDTDGDGIPNWQEQIYGTNPNVPDADKIPKNISRTATDDTVSSTTNLTDRVARDIYVAGQYVKDGQGSVKPEIIAGAISSSVKDIISDNPAPNFKTVSSNDKNTIKTYGNDMAGVFAFILGTKQKELDVFANNLEKGTSMDYIVKLLPVINVSCTYINNYQKIPYGQEDLHARLVLACNKYYMILNSFINANDDPVRAAAAVSLYKSNIFDLYKIYTEYRKLILDNNVVYKTTDYGYLFTVTN
jgi:hypothetical protein